MGLIRKRPEQLGGAFAVGATKEGARMARDRLEQMARVANVAEEFGRFAPIFERELFEMGYWPLEQAKLKTKEEA